MSASEKLKRLEVTGAFVEHGFMPPETAEKLTRLHEALPQIVAVVEAAQSVTSADQGAWHGSRLLLSLAALDEALTKTVSTDSEQKP